MIDHVHVLRLRRMAKKRGPGRPGFGITETSITFRAPSELVESIAKRAEREGITASEAWRRAARAWLGLKPDAYEQYLESK